MQAGMETTAQTTGPSEEQAECFAGRRVHLIGIGGSGMRALALTLLDDGAHVSGSDLHPSAGVSRLSDRGASVQIGQRAENLPSECDLVVYSAAIHEQNPELLAARRAGVDVAKYSEMLGRLMTGRTGIAIAGTHGKSTTTAMVAYALRHAGADPSFIVGATVDQLGGPSGVGAGRHFVVEACEYDRSFLNLQPRLAGILNVEEDHLDCYTDLAAIVEAFRSFAARVAPEGVLIVNGEDPEALEAARGASCEVQSFGFAESCNWRGMNESAAAGCFHMDVALDGEPFCRLKLSLPGRHNAYNALAAAALLHHAGLPREAIVDGLESFSGARRRLTLKARAAGVTVVDDFAHHPTEITASLRALWEHYSPQRLLCVFQPHQHSRTRFLLKDFARSFSAATEVIVPDIYFVRDSVREKDYISSQDLVSQIRLNGGTARYLQTFEEISRYLEQTLRDGDLVVTMGAGNVWEVADETVRRLGRDRQN
jgi:UDP-N-acetylmuramate--alanine ligase